MALMATEPKVVWELAAELGEEPVWVERDQALWDIKKQLIHRYHSQSLRRFRLEIAGAPCPLVRF
jgi:sugar lactone lactonase YvrE